MEAITVVYTETQKQ